MRNAVSSAETEKKKKNDADSKREQRGSDMNNNGITEGSQDQLGNQSMWKLVT